MSIVLMYHALYRDDKDLQRITPEDRPYAVKVEDFLQQLAVLSEYNTGLLQASPSDNPEVLVTFDDGHVSNFDRALPLLADAGINAYFFVTSDFVDQRAHFCSSAQLREMSDAGMVIGAHGKTHRFFADLDDGDALIEFNASRELLECATGRKVDTLSFPGGRYKPQNLMQATSCGYREIYGSGFGAIAVKNGRCIAPVNRIPLKQNTSLDSFQQIVSGNRRYYACESAKSSCKVMLKRMLGNNRYHALYKIAAER